MTQKPSGAQIRQSFIDFFVERKHTFVPSASLVPGGDATLLFTNAGMVQFKDVFLGTDKRPYTRAVDSQKVLRVAGKHNDLDEVGRDDTHHTFFEMLGNWSFGDYYKKDALAWSWQLLTDVWGLPRDRLYTTCFKDDKGNIPTDEEAAEIWKLQPGIDPEHILFFGRKENFWEMAETGPCGPCSEIHLDRGEEYDNLAGKPHRCGVNGECQRYLELWNNVFIQYNRIDKDTLEPLPARHVDTGMGFERIVSVIQDVDSDYKIDLFSGALDALRSLTGASLEEMYADFTPYRVIADHGRAAAFLIADGVVPGNVGRNYICRMIIRRAARFGTKLGLHQPFLAKVADAFISSYGDFYPELVKSRETIIDNLTREEVRFAQTVEKGTAYLEGMLEELRKSGGKVLDGRKAFDLHATYGLPFEISRDIAREQDLDVDEAGFRLAMDEHRIASGGGNAIGRMTGEDAEFYSKVLQDLQQTGAIGDTGVEYNPYEWLHTEGALLALVANGRLLADAGAGDRLEVLLPKTGFYIESGGQVSDTGVIRAANDSWEIEVDEMRKPSAGVIVHAGEVIFGHPKTGDLAFADVDPARRHDIRRNHTATHLLHAALRKILGEHVRQAGSVVSPEHLRFDFTHHQPIPPEVLAEIEAEMNRHVWENLEVVTREMPYAEAIALGAMALFGEKYGDVVRTITVPGVSRELCGGCHVRTTGQIGLVRLVGETGVGAGVRRIEALTGPGAFDWLMGRVRLLDGVAGVVGSAPEHLARRVEALVEERKKLEKRVEELIRGGGARADASTTEVNGTTIAVTSSATADRNEIGAMVDAFRSHPRSGVLVVLTTGERPGIHVAVTDDLVAGGVVAPDLVNRLAALSGGKGGGRPHFASAGAGDPSKLGEVERRAPEIVREALESHR